MPKVFMSKAKQIIVHYNDNSIPSSCGPVSSVNSKPRAEIIYIMDTGVKLRPWFNYIQFSKICKVMWGCFLNGKETNHLHLQFSMVWVPKLTVRKVLLVMKEIKVHRDILHNNSNSRGRHKIMKYLARRCPRMFTK